MRPTICDIPAKDELVSGIYEIPDSAGKIKIKITDLLSESLELEVQIWQKKLEWNLPFLSSFVHFMQIIEEL